jgi:hypothetical protein
MKWLPSFNTTLQSVRIRLHVSAKNDWPPPGQITRILKLVYFTKVYRLKYKGKDKGHLRTGHEGPDGE